MLFIERVCRASRQVLDGGEGTPSPEGSQSAGPERSQSAGTPVELPVAESWIDAEHSLFSPSCQFVQSRHEIRRTTHHLGLASKCQILAGPRAQMAACMHIRARVPVCLCACAPVRLCACVTTPLESSVEPPRQACGTPMELKAGESSLRPPQANLLGMQPPASPVRNPWETRASLMELIHFAETQTRLRSN